MNGDLVGKVMVIASGLLGLAYIFATGGMTYRELEVEAKKKRNRFELFSVIVAGVSLVISIGALFYSINLVSELEGRVLRLEREGAWPVMPQ